MTMVDPLAGDLDIVSINTYNGWYTGDRLSDLPGSLWNVPADKPAWSFPNSVRMRNRVSTARTKCRNSPNFRPNITARRWPWRTACPLRGLSPWILKDFRSPRRQNPDFQMGWNRKA
jgi:beta-glucuronidase